MSQHHSEIHWQRSQHQLVKGTYSRNHVATLSGEQRINVSASVEYKGDPACADPEQLLVTSVATCHMLTFLAIAEYQGYSVEEYEDRAVGYLERVDGGMAIKRIQLYPLVRFGSERPPNQEAIDGLHERAHKNCFIAKSINADVVVLTKSPAA